MKKLKLYVWPDFKPDYYSGLAFAIAETIEEAQELIIEEGVGDDTSDWGYIVEYPVNQKIAFYREGEE